MFTRHAVVELPELGEVTLVAADSNLVGVYFPGHWYLPDPAGFGSAVDGSADPVLRQAGLELTEFVRGDRTSFEIATATSGSPFEERVWGLLRELRFGETTTYGDLAERLGDRSLARRVGQAVGRNPISVVIGCHRVVGKDGALRGYAGGLTRKRLLLDLESGRLRVPLAA
jgi:methylated-DNA-[protein]-cysteine S-methyltransferase